MLQSCTLDRRRGPAQDGISTYGPRRHPQPRLQPGISISAVPVGTNIPQRLVDHRPREGGVSPERHALTLGLLALNLRQEQLVPVVGAGDVARPQLGRQTVAVIVEQEQRVVETDSKCPL